VKDVLSDLELRVIEFFSEWLVALLMPARHVLETRSPHLSFMLLKDYGSKSCTWDFKFRYRYTEPNPSSKPWFEDETVAKTAAEPVHGLRLIKEDVLPISDYQNSKP